MTLLESTQVFSSANHNNSLAEIVTAVLYALPVLILVTIDRYDWIRRVNSIFLEGNIAYYIEYAIKLVFTAAIARGAYLCWHQSRAINRQLDKLGEKKREFELREKEEREQKEREQTEQAAPRASVPARQNRKISR